MAKDDYFVIAYRILSYLYTCFKAGDPPDMDIISPAALEINNGYWVNMLESLAREGYIIGVSFPSAIGRARGVKIIDLKITQKGIEFLQENSAMQKAAQFLKTVKEIIPGL